MSKLSLREAKWPNQLQSGDTKNCTQVKLQSPNYQHCFFPLKYLWTSHPSTNPQTWQLFALQGTDNWSHQVPWLWGKALKDLLPFTFGGNWPLTQQEDQKKQTENKTKRSRYDFSSWSPQITEQRFLCNTLISSLRPSGTICKHNKENDWTALLGEIS